MMQTLIGADGLVLTLSGRLEIGFEFSGTSGPVRTVIEAHPGIGVPVQRAVLVRPCILDVETLQPIDYANYPFRAHIELTFRGPGGKA